MANMIVSLALAGFYAIVMSLMELVVLPSSSYFQYLSMLESFGDGMFLVACVNLIYGMLIVACANLIYGMLIVACANLIYRVDWQWLVDMYVVMKSHEIYAYIVHLTDAASSPLCKVRTSTF